MRRFRLLASLLLVSLPFVLAMDGGNTSEDGDLEIPEPDTKYDVLVTDNTGTVATLESFTWDGFIHVQGKLGSGEIAIPFKKVKRIDFEPAERKGKVVARVALKSGEVVRLTAAGSLTCYGKAAFGNYQIAIKNAARIEFSGEQKPTAKSDDATNPDPE